MSIANCATCVYLGLQHIEPGMAVTVCRRNAPGAKGWPAIQAPDTDGCGQHKPKTLAERGTCGNCRHMARKDRKEDRNTCHEQPRPVWTTSGIVTFPPVYDWESCSRWEAKP